MAWPRRARTGRSGGSATSRSGHDRDDRLSWIKFSGASWTKDGGGFYYGRFPEPKPGEDLKGANYYQKLYYHRSGTRSRRTILVYERPDQKEWQFHGTSPTTAST